MGNKHSNVENEIQQPTRVQGHHECEVFSRGQPESTESTSKWNQCVKNPHHKQFIPAETFVGQYLPRLQSIKHREKMRAMIDLTVRLRVYRTSSSRPNEDEFSEYRGTDTLRMGTAFISCVSVPKRNKPCPCEKCNGKIKRKHWIFKVSTARHLVYNTEEALKTKVDVFYDSEHDQLNDMTNTGFETALGVTESNPQWGACDMLWVTCDETIGKRIESARNCLLDNSEENDIDLSDLCLDSIPSRGEGHSLALMISHPHGQPKKISLGQVTNKTEPFLDYTTATCPGSSGAKVFVFPGLTYLPMENKFTPIHNGSCSTALSNSEEQINYAVGWY